MLQDRMVMSLMLPFSVGYLLDVSTGGEASTAAITGSAAHAGVGYSVSDVGEEIHSHIS